MLSTSASARLSALSHNILIDKLRKCGLNEGTVGWIENWLSDRSQKVIIVAQGLVGGLAQLMVLQKYLRFMATGGESSD